VKLASIVRTEYGRQPHAIEPVAAGLGSRRFYRVRFNQGRPATLIARIEAQEKGRSKPTPIDPAEPPAWLPEPLIEPLRSFLEAAGLPVPHSYAHLPEHGIDLLEDVGDCTLADAREPARSDLYREACEIVPSLQRLSARAEDIPAFGRIFDRALVGTKSWKWLHWAIPGLLGREPEPREVDAVQSAFSRISDLLDAAPRRLAHRDFKAENLHLVGEPERLVMIDVQGAFMAPPEYDLVCLLYDLQVDLDEDFVQESFRKTLPSLPDAPDLPTARLRFDALATVRLCKDISHLAYAARVRNDTRRWHEIPRGLALLDRATGRLGHTLPEIRELTSVIQALTAAVGSSDSSSQGRV
jgi:aminoglycoside/choline kinase family phosphotransferase